MVINNSLASLADGLDFRNLIYFETIRKFAFERDGASCRFASGVKICR